MPIVNKFKNLDSVICNLKWNVLGKEVFDNLKKCKDVKKTNNIWLKYLNALHRQGRIKSFQKQRWKDYPREWIDKNFY